MKSKYIRNLLGTLVLVSLAGCSGSGSCPPGSNGGVGSYNLVVDDTSPVPLVNTKSQQFYVYMKNVGVGNASNLSWSIANNTTTQSSGGNGLWNKLKNSLGLSSDKKLAIAAGDEIKILDASACTNVASGASCRILLQASDPASVILQSSSPTSTSSVTQNIVSAYGYTPSYTGPEGTLTLSPLSPLNYGNGFASYTFFIINNSTNSISLDQAPFGTLPAGINYSLLAGQTCPNPLPGQSVCQVRMTLSSSGSTTGNTVAVNLTPSGTVVGGSQLPTQGSNLLTVSDEKLGNVTASTPSMVVDANSSVSATEYAYISNTGSAPLSLGNLSTTSSVVSLSADECSGKTLNVGEVCRYQINADSSQINGSGSAVITIPYNNGKTSGSTSTSLNWKYISLVTPNPGLSLSSSGALSQANLSSTITILNSGNVILRDIGAPSLTTSSSHVTLSNNNCTTSLAVGASCSYTLTYAPAAPSETTTATVGSISAKYVDQNGTVQSITIPSTTSVNVSSIYQGFIATGGDFSLNASTPSKTITLTNNGNYKATISSIAISGSNLQKTDGNCIGDIAAQTSCTMTVSLQNSTTAGSGNGTLTITYNNNNGSSNATSVSNASWVIGEAASLNVTFVASNLVAIVGSESTNQVTLTNNGNTQLNNITLPTLPSGFSWRAGAAPACVLNNTQSLALSASCNLLLVYAPTTSSAGVQVNLGKFSATTAQSTAYSSSNDYMVTATALRQASLSFGSTTAISQTPNWTNQTASTTVTVTNTNGSPITITGITVGGVAASASGCSGQQLASGASCNLTVSGTYSASGSGSLTINYNDVEGPMVQSLPITVTYQAQPVITPNLTITKNPSGAVTVLNNGSQLAITLTLTNTSTVQNAINPATDGNIKVNAASLIPASGGGITYAAGNSGTCQVSGGYITISNQSPSNSCTYVINVSSTAANGTTASATATSQYQVQSYTNPTSATYGADQSGAQIAVNSTVQLAQALLTAPVLVDSSQSNAFVGIEQGITAGPISFTVQNVGALAVSGAITAPTIAGFTFDMSNCTNLASGASCTFTATLNSTNTISGNLSTSNLTYNTTSTAVLPNMQYSVIAANSPSISQTVTVANCQQGNGTSAMCNINTGSPAPIVTVTVTLTNNGSAAANNFSVNTTALQAALGSGYSGVTTSGCTGNLGIGSQCVLTIAPTTPNTSAASLTTYDIARSNVGYSYNYGTSNQLSTSANTPNFGVNTTIVTPVITVSAFAESIPATGSESTTVTLSNWYSGTLPSNPTFTITPSGSNISTSSCVWSAVQSGATCTVILTTTGTTTAGTYALTATAGGITSDPRAFEVTSTAPAGCTGKCIFVTAATYDGNLGGFAGADTKCNADINKPDAGTYKALLVGNNATTNGIDYYRTDNVTKIATATGGNLVGFNSLNNAISTVGYQVWTGYISSFTCSTWTSNTIGYGETGMANFTNNSYISYGEFTCSDSYHLYCVKQ